MTSALLVFDPLCGYLKKASIGDKEAAKALVNNISPKLFRTAYRLLGNSHDAEEATQETLIKLWKIAKDWKTGNAKIETWCYRVLTNHCFDKLRAKNRYIFDEIDENVQANEIHTDDLMARGEIRNQIDLALDKLPARQKTAIIMTYFEGLGAKDVAASLDCTIEAVESLLARAKKALKQCLQEHDENFGQNIMSFALN